MTERPKLVAVVSGGLDSTTLLYDALENDFDVVRAVSFNYGQRHKKELDYAAATCNKLGISHTVIDLWSSGLTDALAGSGSSLVTETDVPEGHYAEDSMKSTVVPNRNMIMLSIAGAIAVADEAQAVGTGVHAGDHFVYPDCRTGFVGAAALAMYLGNEGMSDLWRAPIWAPYIHKSKTDIAYKALMLGVPLYETWSCYKGGEKHCGRCGTCVERIEAIDEATKRYNSQPKRYLQALDMTEYEDTEYWKTVTNK